MHPKRAPSLEMFSVVTLQAMLQHESIKHDLYVKWITKIPTKKEITAVQNFQGDVEKTLGWKPIPLFDRDHAQEVASMQVCMHKQSDKKGE